MSLEIQPSTRVGFCAVAVPKPIEGLGLIGVALCVMLVFSIGTLGVIFVYHSGLSAVYSISQQTHIPFLVILSSPFWGGFIVASLVNSIRWLLRKRIP